MQDGPASEHVSVYLFYLFSMFSFYLFFYSLNFSLASLDVCERER